MASDAAHRDQQPSRSSSTSSAVDLGSSASISSLSSPTHTHTHAAPSPSSPSLDPAEPHRNLARRRTSWGRVEHGQDPLALAQHASASIPRSDSPPRIVGATPVMPLDPRDNDDDDTFAARAYHRPRGLALDLDDDPFRVRDPARDYGPSTATMAAAAWAT